MHALLSLGIGTYAVFALFFSLFALPTVLPAVLEMPFGLVSLNLYNALCWSRFIFAPLFPAAAGTIGPSTACHIAMLITDSLIVASAVFLYLQSRTKDEIDRNA